jgi:hypothetical protein
MRPLSHRVTIAAVGACALLGSAVAWASIPDSAGVIHGCRKTSDGSVRVIDTAVTQNCPNGFVSMNWNQTGPQGPTGPAGATGAQGATGPAGPQGPAGFANLTLRNATIPVPANTQVTESANCLQTETAISAGWQNIGGGRVEVVSNGPGFPLGGQTDHHRWSFVLDNKTSINATYVLYAYCVPGNF